MDSIDHERLWDFLPAAQIGDILKPGDILGTVQETEAVLHKIMVPQMWRASSHGYTPARPT